MISCVTLGKGPPLPSFKEGGEENRTRGKRVWGLLWPGTARCPYVGCCTLRTPPEEVLVCPCYRPGNCCPERFRCLANITQQVVSKARIQTQVPLILSTPHRLLWGPVYPQLTGAEAEAGTGDRSSCWMWRFSGQQANKIPESQVLGAASGACDLWPGGESSRLGRERLETRHSGESLVGGEGACSGAQPQGGLGSRG